MQEYVKNDDSNRVPPMQKYQELMDNSNAIGFAQYKAEFEFGLQ